MESKELLEIKLKKFSVNQIISKLQRGCPEVEKEICISILKKRGQDVSKFKPVSVVEPETVKNEVVEKVEEPLNSTRQQLIEEVDEFVDTLIEDHRDGVYTEVIKTLGGTFESDLDELFENATEAQLKEALSFKNIKSKKSDTSEIKSVKKVVEPKKKVQKEEGNEKLLKSETIDKFSDFDDFSVDSKISFEVNGESKNGIITRIFIHHKTNKEQCRIKGDDNKIYFKTVKNIKLIK
jgi:hypothetical protein